MQVDYSKEIPIREEFLAFLNEEQRQKVYEVDSLYEDFFDIYLAKQRLEKWKESGYKSYTLDELKQKIDSK